MSTGLPDFPQTIPPDTLLGRTGISAGPVQALPFSTLANIFPAPPLPSSGGTSINAASLGFIGDGVTDNGDAGTGAFSNWQLIGNTLGLGGTTTGLQNSTYVYGAVTVTADTPTTVTVSGGHGLEQNDCFIFSGTPGSTLPAGLSFNTPYFVKGANLTVNSFQFSTVNANWASRPEGAGVNSSGAGGGTISIVQLNNDWVTLLYPPGSYYVTSGFAGAWTTGNRKIAVVGYGAFFPKSFIQPVGVNNSLWSYIQTFQQTYGSPNTVTCNPISAAAQFQVNQWILIGGIDLFAGQGFPPGLRNFQFVQIVGINYGTGVISFAPDNVVLDGNYRSSWPQYGLPRTAGQPNFSFTGGPASIMAMPERWDTDFILQGVHIGNDNNGAWTFNARTITLIDCTFESGGFPPSAAKQYYARNCTWNGVIESDKLVENEIFEDCTIFSLIADDSSISRMIINRCNIDIMHGTPRKLVIRDSRIGRLSIGAGFGNTDSIQIIDSRVALFGGYASRSDITTIGGWGGGALCGFFTFSNGTLTLPSSMSQTNFMPQFASVMNPGNKMFFTGQNSQANLNINGGSFNTQDNLGAPFVIYDAYQNANGDFVYDTSLASFPSGLQKSSQVSITAASPAVVTWTAHGLPSGTVINIFTSESQSGVHGISPPTFNQAPTQYFVSTTGITANTFQLSTNSNGVGGAVNTTASTNTISACMATFQCTTPPTVQGLHGVFAFNGSGQALPTFVDAPVGSAIVVAIGIANANVDISLGSVTDDAGNTYTLAVQPAVTAGVQSCAFYRATVTNDLSAGSRIRYTNGAGIGGYVAASWVITGGGTVTVDKTVTQIVSAPALTSAISLTSGTLSATNEVLFVAFQNLYGGTGSPGTAAGGLYGFQEQSGWINTTQGISVRAGFSSAYKIVSATTTQVYNPTPVYVLGVANQIGFSCHPCPKFTANGNTGPTNLEDLNGAYEEPVWSRAKRVLAGFGNYTFNNKLVPMPGMYVWGTITSLAINVIQAYTSTGTAILTVNGTGWTSNMASSNMVQTIDLTTVGLRTITATTFSGLVGTDSIAAYAGWLSNGITLNSGGTGWGAGTGTLAQQPIVEISITTNQGITAFFGLEVVDNNQTNQGGVLFPANMSDTTVIGNQSN